MWIDLIFFFIENNVMGLIGCGKFGKGFFIVINIFFFVSII